MVEMYFERPILTLNVKFPPFLTLSDRLQHVLSVSRCHLVSSSRLINHVVMQGLTRSQHGLHLNPSIWSFIGTLDVYKKYVNENRSRWNNFSGKEELFGLLQKLIFYAANGKNRFKFQ